MATDADPRGVRVSKRMFVVLAAMLLVILLPTVLVSLPMSKIVVTFTNMEDTQAAHLRVTIRGVCYFPLNLDPGESSESVRTVSMGTYEVYVRYWFDFGNQSYYCEYGRTYPCSVSMFETEEVELELYDECSS